MTTWPPVVYVGPSLDADEVRRRLPGCQVMPPIRRGDLYRDRLLGFDVFVMLDGVFAQELAVSPREAIDVARDGALVVGASSMGALRAADCWPAGVRGVGSVYRLFRRGALTSDAEVAVTFSPEAPYTATSVPLVNVRYALSRCMRKGLLERAAAERLLRSATAIFFADRAWPLVLKSAGVFDPDGTLRRALVAHDLKRLDAIRALQTVPRWAARRPRPRKHDGTITRRIFQGARPREATHSVPGIGRRTVSGQSLWQWLVATGRYRRYAAGTQTSTTLAAGLAQPDGPLARSIRVNITKSGDADAIAFAFMAIEKAARWGRRCHPGGEFGHHPVVMGEVAHAHGFANWQELENVLRDSPVWPWIARTVDAATVARHVRQELFAQGGDPGGRLAPLLDQEWM